jgi:hypothetical protein
LASVGWAEGPILDGEPLDGSYALPPLARNMGL